MSDQPIVRIEDLHKSFGEVEVLKGISFAVDPKEVVVLIGPSGTGKSTLLQCINLLTRPTAGKIWLEDQEITAPGIDVDKVRQRIGMVFQEFNLFNHLTALGNVTVGMSKVLGLKPAAAREKGLWELERVGLSAHADKYPAQLSRWPETARGHCASAGHGSARDVVRRTDLRARSRAHRRGFGGDAKTGA